MTDTAPTPTRQERLAAQREQALTWARTATTDDIPGDLTVTPEATTAPPVADPDVE